MAVELFIDTDNALGSDRGDVDDAYAIAALVRSGASIAAISSVAGNVTESEAHENNRRLCSLLGWSGPLLRGAEARDALADFRGRVVAIGPLTNVAAAQNASEIIVVGGNSASPGRWPPLWPHEFNLTFDRRATHAVFASSVPLTILPLNVARKLWVRQRDLDSIGGPPGETLREGTQRWFRTLLWRRHTQRFAIYDLAAALYAIDDVIPSRPSTSLGAGFDGEESPSHLRKGSLAPLGMTNAFHFEETTVSMRANTFLEFGRGARAVKVCRALDGHRLWRRFLAIVQ